MFKFEFVCIALIVALAYSAIVTTTTSKPGIFVQDPNTVIYRDMITSDNRLLIQKTNPTLTSFKLAENQFISLTDS